jgi:hypothetical protein
MYFYALYCEVHLNVKPAIHGMTLTASLHHPLTESTHTALSTLLPAMLYFSPYQIQ